MDKERLLKKANKIALLQKEPTLALFDELEDVNSSLEKISVLLEMSNQDTQDKLQEWNVSQDTIIDLLKEICAKEMPEPVSLEMPKMPDISKIENLLAQLVSKREDISIELELI